MKQIYVAGRNNIHTKSVVSILEDAGFKVISPFRDIDQSQSKFNIFNNCIRYIELCDYFIIVSPFGKDTSFELGFAFAVNKNILYISTDCEFKEEFLACAYNCMIYIDELPYFIECYYEDGFI